MSRWHVGYLLTGLILGGCFVGHALADCTFGCIEVGCMRYVGFGLTNYPCFKVLPASQGGPLTNCKEDGMWYDLGTPYVHGGFCETDLFNDVHVWGCGSCTPECTTDPSAGAGCSGCDYDLGNKPHRSCEADPPE